MSFAHIGNSPGINALNEAIKTPQREYKNPGQISIFDSLTGRSVDYWDKHAGGKSNNSRKITIQKKDAQRQKAVFVYGVEDYTKLSKFDVDAQKLFCFYTEKLLKSPDKNRVIEKTVIIYIYNKICLKK